MKINILDKSIANMIAAGEVVERPASVVKELCENSIDSGAKSITVEIKKGGMELIRITDDGCGIDPNEVVTAFKRHATSKIKTKEDLNTIYTLGFRGEALASIAAVARVDIFTKTKDNAFGYTAHIEGGNVTDEEEAGCPDGTTITVKDLFFNTPARMKFLKTDSTETSYVTDICNKIILSHPDIKIKLIVNGKITASSMGNGSDLSAIKSVFGRDYEKSLLPVSYNEDSVKIEGYVGNNSLSRKDRRQQVFFINGRYIKSNIISSAVSEAFQNVMMVGKFPFALLKISVSSAFVDVNVHPAKTEVRFSDEKKVYSSVYWAVKNALSEKKYIPEINISQNKGFSSFSETKKEKSREYSQSVDLLKDTYIKNISENNSEMPKETADSDKNVYEIKKSAPHTETMNEKISKGAFFSKEEMSSFKNASNLSSPPAAPFKKESPENAPAFKDLYSKEETIKSTPKDESNKESITENIENSEKAEQVKDYRAGIDFNVIGQIFSTYIIVQIENEMLLIDQHAAHERIYFEQLLSEYKKNKGIKKQMILMPVTVDFDPIEFECALNNLNYLDKFGFECDHFGSESLIVRTVPEKMSDTQIKDTVREIVSIISKGTNDIEKAFMEDCLHTISCKKAIKANMTLTLKQMEEITKKVLSFKHINTCPHGRPIIISMTKYELEKNFKRIV